MNPDSYDLFVSFANEDEGVARWVTRCLQSEGFRVFFYPDHPSIVRWRRDLLKILVRSKAVVLLGSSNSPSSSMQRAEFDKAKNRRIPIVGLQVGHIEQELLDEDDMLGFLENDWLGTTGDWTKDSASIVGSLRDCGVEPGAVPAIAVFPAEPDDDLHLRNLISKTRAQKGNPRDVPRPKVAASLVWNNEVLWSSVRDAGNHAEQVLLRGARLIPAGSTLYTTLEPCTKGERGHESCAQTISASGGISRVVIAHVDCNPEMRGKGISSLQEKRLDVVLGHSELFHEAETANIEYFNYFRTSAGHARKRILIAVPAFQEMPFFGELLQALLKEFDIKNFDGVPAVLGSSEDPIEQERFLEALPLRQPEYQGFVFFPTPPKAGLRRRLKAMPDLLGKPVIYLDINPFEGEMTGNRTYYVGSQSGGREAADFVKHRIKKLDGGETRRILLICSRTIKPERRTDFVSQLERAGFKISVKANAEKLSRQEGRELARQSLLSHSFRAIYATSDELAIGAYEAVQELNRTGSQRVLPDLILGFDGLQEMRKRIEGGGGGLATLAQDLDGIAERVVEIFEAELGNNGHRVATIRSQRKHELPPKLFPHRPLAGLLR